MSSKRMLVALGVVAGLGLSSVALADSADVPGNADLAVVSGGTAAASIPVADAVKSVEAALAKALGENQAYFRELRAKLDQMISQYMTLREAPKREGFAYLRFGIVGKQAFSSWELKYPEGLDPAAELGVQALPPEVYADVNRAIEAAYDQGFGTFPLAAPEGRAGRLMAWGKDKVGLGPRSGPKQPYEGRVVDEAVVEPTTTFARYEQLVADTTKVLAEAKAFHADRTKDGGLDVNLKKQLERQYASAQPAPVPAATPAAPSTVQGEQKAAVEQQLKAWRTTWNGYVDRHDELLDELEGVINEYRRSVTAYCQKKSVVRLREALQVWHQAKLAEGPGTYVQAIPGELPKKVEELVTKAFYDGLRDALAANLTFERTKAPPASVAAAAPSTGAVAAPVVPQAPVGDYVALFRGEPIAKDAVSKRADLSPEKGTIALRVAGSEEPFVYQATTVKPKGWTEYFAR